MMEMPIRNPLEHWTPILIAIAIGLLVAIRTYMRGPECPSPAEVHGKTVVITGASSGIGKATAHELARRGATVVIACRDINKGQKSADEITRKLPTNCGKLSVMKLDLGSFKSVRNFVKEFCEKYDKLDVLINNAGVMLCPFAKTEDGFETHLQVNYLSHFMLTDLLMDKLKAAPSARVINVSALAHKVALLRLDDLNSERNYVAREAYGQSKLALILFANHLAKKLHGTNVTVNSLHPGIVRDTELMRHMTMNQPLIRIVAFPITWTLLKTPKDGAQTIVYLAVEPSLNGTDKTTGKYFSDCEIKSPSPDALNEDLARELWDVTIKMTKVNKSA